MNAAELPCPCGRQRYRTVLTGIYNRVGYSGYRFGVLECSNCGLARTDPMPDVAQYEKEGYEAETPFAQGTTDLWSESIAGHVARLSRPGRLLVVGTHTGNLHPPLQARGYEVVGLDIDPVAVQKARAAGRTVVLADLLDAGFDEASFEVVTMIHTFEHLANPNEIVAECARILKPGGLLFINVPNHRGLLPRLMKDHWIGWVAPQHVWQFEPRTLEAIVRRAGPFETTYLRAAGSMEPPSTGAKGAAKKLVARAGDRVRWGDQVVSAFRRRP